MSMNKIIFSYGRTSDGRRKEMSAQRRALLAFFDSPMIRNVRMSSPDSLDDFIYDDFEFELNGKFLDGLHELFSRHGIHLVKETVRLKLVFMQKYDGSAAFVLTITSGLSSPVRKKEKLQTVQTARSIDEGLVSLFDKFQLRYMRDMFSCTVEDSDFHLAFGCIIPSEHPE